MEALQYLLIIQAATTTFNILVCFLLWKSSREPLFRTLIGAWASALLVLVVMAAAAGQSHFVRALTFSSCFLLHYSLALTLARLTGQSFRGRLFVLTMLAALGLATLLHAVGAPHYVVTLIISLAAALPGIIVASSTLFRGGNRFSFTIRSFAVLVLVGAVHLQDYVFIYDNPSLLEAGFTFGFIAVVGLTLFSFGAVLEHTATENARLVFELELREQLIHSARLAAIGELAGGVAHEINNPLAILRIVADSIIVHTSRAKLDPALLAEQARKLGTSVTRIARIVSALQRFSKHRENEPVEVEMASQILKEPLDLTRERFREEGVQLTVSGLEGDWLIRCRPSEISQALLNLLNNAREAVSWSSEKAVSVTLSSDGLNVEIAVTDTGPRIAPDEEQNLFRAFFTTKERAGGTGLGLSVSKEIAEAYGGRLRYAPEAGRTRFVLSLPLAARRGARLA